MEPIDSLSRGAIALGTQHEELYPFSVSTIRVGIGGYTCRLLLRMIEVSRNQEGAIE
jgi:hypothetical protein